MKLADKILMLRKKQGLSQEELADQLGVSRQAISRWEVGSAQPDAANIVQLSKLFQVTTDYLLHDDYKSDKDVPVVKETEQKVKEEVNRRQAFIFVVGLHAMIFIYQIIACFIYQNRVFSLAGILLSIVVVIGFEIGYSNQVKSKQARNYYYLVYIVTAWLTLYFPIRLLIYFVMKLYPRPYSVFLLEIVILLVYLLIAAIITYYLQRKQNKLDE